VDHAARITGETSTAGEPNVESCKEWRQPVPDRVKMKTPPDYTLFGHAVSRRLFYWSLFLCPALALMIYLSTRLHRDSVTA
jgi:hypothetical protein